MHEVRLIAEGLESRLAVNRLGRTSLEEQGLLIDYLGGLRDRLAEMYGRVGQRIRAVRPDFIFSAYMFFTPGDLQNSWRFEGATLGLHSPSAPYFFIDPSHYYPHHSAPWWETSYPKMKALGMKHILGSWVGGLYGDLPQLNVSAAQWIYEAAMSHDGYWVWYENRFGPTDTRMLRAADKRISAVESKGGDLLMKGTLNYTFTCLVEQSGDPDRQRSIRQRTYQADDRHLVWVFNGNTDHAVSVLARFPRLPEGRQWIVRDLLSDLPYTRSGTPTWSDHDLANGVLLELEKRSDAWLLIAPAAGEIEDETCSIRAEVIHTHPSRPDTGTEQQLSDRAGNEYEPCWSPGGAKITCTANTHGSFVDILVLEVKDGTVSNPLMLIQSVTKQWYTFSNIRGIAWSADGNRIAASFEDSKHRRREQVQRDEAMRFCGIAAQTLMLSAKAMGYESCPMDGFDFDAVGKLINLPPGHVIAMFVAIGKPTKEPWPRPGQLPLSEIVITDRFN